MTSKRNRQGQEFTYLRYFAHVERGKEYSPTDIVTHWVTQKDDEFRPAYQAVCGYLRRRLAGQKKGGSLYYSGDAILDKVAIDEGESAIAEAVERYGEPGLCKADDESEPAQSVIQRGAPGQSIFTRVSIEHLENESSPETTTSESEQIHQIEDEPENNDGKTKKHRKSWLPGITAAWKGPYLKTVFLACALLTFGISLSIHQTFETEQGKEMRDLDIQLELGLEEFTAYILSQSEMQETYCPQRLISADERFVLRVAREQNRILESDKSETTAFNDFMPHVPCMAKFTYVAMAPGY